MPMVATAVPKMPPTLTPLDVDQVRLTPEPEAGEQRDADRQGGHERRLEADRRARR